MRARQKLSPAKVQRKRLETKLCWRRPPALMLTAVAWLTMHAVRMHAVRMLASAGCQVSS